MESSEITLAHLVHKHEQDLYRGNGKPGFITRIEELETAKEAHRDRMNAHDHRIDAIDKKFWAIILLLLTLLGGVVTDIVMKSVGNRSGLIVGTPVVATGSVSEMK